MINNIKKINKTFPDELGDCFEELLTFFAENGDFEVPFRHKLSPFVRKLKVYYRGWLTWADEEILPHDIATGANDPVGGLKYTNPEEYVRYKDEYEALSDKDTVDGALEEALKNFMPPLPNIYTKDVIEKFKELRRHKFLPDNLGGNIDKPSEWDEGYSHLEKYYKERGHSHVHEREYNNFLLSNNQISHHEPSVNKCSKDHEEVV